MTMTKNTRRGAVAALACLALMLAGCPKKPTPPGPAPAPAPPTASTPPPPVQQPSAGGGNPIVPGGGPAVGGVRGAATKADARNQIYQIALFYNQFFSEMGRGPTNAQELMDYMGATTKEYQSLKEQYFILVPNVNPNSGVVIAYEQKPDNSGNHFVAMGDRSVSLMSTQQLRAALGMR